MKRRAAATRSPSTAGSDSNAPDVASNQTSSRQQRFELSSRTNTSQESALVKARQLSAFDAQTLRYINDELKDATPLERDYVLRSLQGADPPMVRRILQERRRVKRIGQHPSVGPPPIPRTKVAASQSSQLDQIFPGFGHSELRAPDPRQQPIIKGLGTADPWNQNHTDSRMARFQPGSTVGTAGTNSNQDVVNSPVRAANGTLQRPIIKDNQVRPASTSLPAVAPTLQSQPNPIQARVGNSMDSPKKSPKTNPVELAGASRTNGAAVPHRIRSHDSFRDR